MANVTGSGPVAEKGPVTRSSTESLSNKAVASGSVTTATPNRKSEWLEKRTPPSLSARITVRFGQKTPSPLRRSERTKNASPSSSSDPSASKSKSSGSKCHCSGKQLAFEASGDEDDDNDDDEDEESGSEASSRLRPKRMTAREYRALFVKPKRDCNDKTNGMDRSTKEDYHEKTNGMDRSTQEDCHERTNENDRSTLEDCHDKTNGIDWSTQEDCHEKSNEVDRSAQEGDDGGRDKIDGCLKENCFDSAKDYKDILPPEDANGKEMRAEPKLSGPLKELLDNNVTVNSIVSSNAATCEPPSGAPERVQSESCKEETLQKLGSRDSISNENLIMKCVENDKGEKSISSKRKRNMVDMHANASAMLVDNDNSNLIEDAHPSRICGNVVETSGSRSKRIRHISLSESDVKRDGRKTANNVDQPSSKSYGDNLSTRNKDGNSGGPVDSKRPLGVTVETEKIRKQQRSLHLLLKPEIANLCEILRLPDNVKSMVENCLEYTMNNYQICTEPVSILQAFQLSLCWTAASLLNHKLDFEASLMLAKQNLNFDCKKEVVDEINSRLWTLKEKFLKLTGNSNVVSYPKASESSNGVFSYIEETTEVELVKNDNSKNIKNFQKRKSQWNKLLLMQQEEKQKLKKDIENENDEFWRRYQIHRAAIQLCSPNDVTKEQKLKVFNTEYMKIIRELERQHEIRLKDLEAKQLKTRLTFPETLALDELLNPVASNEPGTKVDQTCDQAQHSNAPKALVSDHVAEGEGFNDMVEVITRIGTGIGLSEAPDANASVVVPCSSALELQTPLVKHADANNKCNNIAENEYDSQGNIFSKHSNSREQCSDGAISPPEEGVCVNYSCESHDFGQDAITRVLPSCNEEICDGKTLDVQCSDGAISSPEEGECVNYCFESHDFGQDAITRVLPSCNEEICDGKTLDVQCSDGAISSPEEGECVNYSCESHDFGQDAITRVLPSSNEDICDGKTLDVPSGEVAPTVCNTTSSNGDHVEISSRQGELDGTILSNPVCGSSIEVEANGSNDGAKNMAPVNSQSSEEDIPSVNTMSTSNCENAAQIHEADDNNGSKNAETLNSSLSDERISSLNSKSPQGHVRNENAMCMQNCENFAQSLEDDDSNGSNSVIPNPPLIDERNADRTIILNRDAHVGMVETVNFTPSTEQISGGAVDEDGLPNHISEKSVLDSVLSRPREAYSPRGSSDADCIILSNQPSFEKQNHDGVSSSIPVGQIPLEVSNTRHERISVNVLDGEEAVGRPATVNCTDYPENVIALNSSSMDQISNGGPLLDGDLSPGPCTSSPSNGRTLPDEQIPVLEPENSNKVAECQLTDSVVVNKNAISDQLEGVCRTMTENSLSLETPVSRPVDDLMEPLEQVHSLSSVESPPDPDTAREMKNTLVSSPVDIVPANQSINDSLVMEPPEQEAQLPSAGFLSSNQDLSNLPLVTGTEDQPSNEDDLPNHIPEMPIEIQNQVVQHASNSDRQEGVSRTMTENSLSLETPVSRPVDDLMVPLEQVQPLSSVESPPDRDTAREMQNILVSSSVDIVPANQSMNDSLVMEPPEQEGQLPSAGILSSNQDLANLPLVTGTEDQPSNEDGLPNHIPETSIEIQNQAVVQCASNVELDSCSRQVVHPASNMDLDSLLPGGVRLQSSDTRNLSTLTEINNHPIQPASQSASRIIRHLCLDPLTNELERLRILTDQNMKEYENKKLQLKYDFEKELEELYRKYDIKRKEVEVEFQNIRKNLDTQHNIVLVNKILAEAFRAKSMDLKVSGASRMQQDASVPQQLFQLASQQNATRPCLVGPSSCGPPADSMQSSYATTTSQTMVSPIQATYSTPGTFSSVSPRVPHINSLSSPLGNAQTAGEIRAPAPHLQPYRPPTSIPASSPCTVPHGRPSQPAPGNIPVTSPPFSHRTPWSMPANFQSVPHRGHWLVSTGGLSTPNLSSVNSCADANSQPGINLPNVRPHMPDLPTLMNLNLSKFSGNSTPANSAHPATSPDVVCLSDDE
ncbi:Helicase protein MOM1 [Glycine soja]